MGEKFRSMRGTVRLASTKGHVILVGDEFVDVPDVLVEQALAKKCIPESMYQELKQEVAAEKNPSGFEDEDEGDQERKLKVLEALSKLTALKEQGEEQTPGGEALEYYGKPRVAAVSELAGFKVKAVEIEEALK